MIVDSGQAKIYKRKAIQLFNKKCKKIKRCPRYLIFKKKLKISPKNSLLT